jgi:hypothetical protein
MKRSLQYSLVWKEIMLSPSKRIPGLNESRMNELKPKQKTNQFKTEFQKSIPVGSAKFAHLTFAGNLQKSSDDTFGKGFRYLKEVK